MAEMMDLIGEIKARVFDGRGFVREKAERIEEILKEFGIRYDHTARAKPEFASGEIRHIAGEWRIFGGNTSHVGRWDRWTYYVYPYIAIPSSMTQEQIEEAIRKLKREWPLD